MTARSSGPSLSSRSVLPFSESTCLTYLSLFFFFLIVPNPTTMSFFTKSLLSVLSLSAALIQPATARIGGYEGCFNSVANYTQTGSYIYQSDGYCVSTCKGKGLAIAATQGQLCACGQGVPPAALKVADTQCGNTCPGYPYENCKYFLLSLRPTAILIWFLLGGGDNAWSLYSVAQYNPYAGVSVAPAVITSAASATQITLPSSTPTSFAVQSSPASSSQPTEIVKKPTIQTAQANATNSASNGLGLASPAHAIAASILTFTAAVIPFVLYI